MTPRILRCLSGNVITVILSSATNSKTPITILRIIFVLTVYLPVAIRVHYSELGYPLAHCGNSVYALPFVIVTLFDVLVEIASYKL